MSLIRSAWGSVMPSIALAVKLLASASSNALTRNTEGPAPVMATRTALPYLATMAPATAKPDAGWRSFMYLALSAILKRTAVTISPGCSAVEKRPVKNWSAGILRWLVSTVASRPTTAAG